MGINNRQRRAAKQRKRRAEQGRPGGGPAASRAGWDFRPRADERELAAELVAQILVGVEADPAAAARFARLVTGLGSPVAPSLVAEAVHNLQRSVLVAVLRGGWLPSDLAEVSGRRLTPRHLPALAALLAAEADRHPADRVAPAWREDLAGIGPASPADLATAAGMELALGLLATMSTLPAIAELIPPPGVAVAAGAAASTADGRVLGKVRSLLAKAEATDYPEEAEALSAKAQELISRYALDRLSHRVEHSERDEPVTSRRLWIDAPYVLPKAMLIDVVAQANRCRAVVAEQLGFSTVVGEPSDLAAVELMATSLLVQADTAMLRHGRHTDLRGGSRTTSFRRSFLVSYATRIGERLRSASEDAAADTGRSGELVPVLRRQAERVEAACAQMFPHLVTRQTRISNTHGWAAGRAAADQARLDTHPEVTEATG